MIGIRNSYNLSILLIALFAVILLRPITVLAAESTTKETEASINFEAGQLSLALIPKLDFGTQQIPGKSESFTTTSNCRIQVSDLRGSGDGWHLSLKLSEFTNDKDSTSLKGAAITVASQTITPADDQNASAPPKELQSQLKIVSNADAVNIVGADKGGGRGLWEIQGNDVKLTVLPGTASFGRHTATLTWTLYDAP